MWNKSIGLIIFLNVACVLISGDDPTAGSRTSNVEWLIEKEYKLIFVEATWYAASQICMEHDMLLASINSHEEHQHIEKLIKDKNMLDAHFWISKSSLAQKEVFKWPANQNTPSFVQWEPSNQCTFWYWMNIELCLALRPLASERNYDKCDKKNYFICESIPESEETSSVLKEIELLKTIKEELLKSIDEMMLSGFADALPTATENTWVNLVKGGLHMWFEEQQNFFKPKSLLEKEVLLLAEEVVKMPKRLKNDKLRIFVNKKFEQNEIRLPLVSERFRSLIADEYMKLEEKYKLTRRKSSKSPSDEMINLLVEKVIMLAKIQQMKLTRESLGKVPEVKKQSAVLDEEQMKLIAENLIKRGDEEFTVYIDEIIEQLEYLGVAELDLDMVFQLYLLVKQELFALISKTVMKSTLKERIEITSYGLSRILDGDVLNFTQETSVFGQIFVVLATGLTALVEEKSVTTLDDALIRDFVKNEFQRLRYEDMVDLKYDGYIKFIMDEYIKLASEINLAKNELGELLVDNVISLISTQLFLYAEDEMAMIAEKLTISRDEELNEFQVIADDTKRELYMYEEEKLLILFQLVHKEWFTITVKPLLGFTEEEMIELAEEGLSKLLTGDVFKSAKEKSMFRRLFVSLEEELLKLTKEEFADMEDDQLQNLVNAAFQKTRYYENIELFEEVYLKLITNLFIKLNNERTTTTLTAQEEGKHQFGETVKKLTMKLLETVGNA